MQLNIPYERGFDITDNRLWYSDTKKLPRMYKRFIVPFFYKGIPVGYTARWIGNPPEGMPKYYKTNNLKTISYMDLIVKLKIRMLLL